APGLRLAPGAAALTSEGHASAKPKTTTVVRNLWFCIAPIPLRSVIEGRPARRARPGVVVARPARARAPWFPRAAWCRAPARECAHEVRSEIADDEGCRLRWPGPRRCGR